MEWSDLPDTPENRRLLIRSRHILDWSIETMECARLFGAGYEEREIAEQLGMEGLEVEMALRMMACRIFIVREAKPWIGLGAVVTWLELHAECCIPKWEAEVAIPVEPGELPEGTTEEDIRTLPRWRVWDEAAKMREREDYRAPSVRRDQPRRRR
ncbi:MAG: hypothetical protein ACRDHF_15765 [Tepidiformaceae bacterium]